MNNENSKVWYQSNELLILFGGILNTVLDRFGLPSFELTPEFVGGLLVVVGTLRLFYTKTKLKFSK